MLVDVYGMQHFAQMLTATIEILLMPDRWKKKDFSQKLWRHHFGRKKTHNTTHQIGNKMGIEREEKYRKEMEKLEHLFVTALS